MTTPSHQDKDHTPEWIPYLTQLITQESEIPEIAEGMVYNHVDVTITRYVICVRCGVVQEIKRKKNQ